ncbi:glycosyltransferase family 4 protein [Sphingomonas sp.]|uniref:glycosyltransferase family 4 protein n=1 Tax=Sphingomonas sp. TaxID=28214 RepID=UPI00286DB793|nr:glycosyltransferase family 4 protein [Sphingomonas sp.]
MTPRLLFIASDAAVFVSHRLNLVEAAIAASYQVAVASPGGGAVAAIIAAGATHIPIHLLRGSKNPIHELRSLASIARALRRARPHFVHLITPKPILYGGLVARLMGIPSIAAVTGLGHVFVNRSAAGRLMRRGVALGYRLAINGPATAVIFQNRDDLALFRCAGILRHDRVSLIAGSGTDLAAITPAPLPPGPTVTLLPARLLRDKGVLEFVAAARLLRQRGAGCRFRLLGDPDVTNPTSVTLGQLAAWVAEGVVDWQPHTSDIGAALAACHIVALPSYREGFPKTLIDAAAAGRAAVASDVPGCRDAIVDGVTGLLCKPRDGADLAATLAPLIADRALQQRLGDAARRHAEAHFDVDDVTAAHLELYSSVLDRPRRTALPANVSGRRSQ